MLYRAFAGSATFDSYAEICVFFESDTRGAAADRLRQMLATTWGCEPIHVGLYNLADEAELRAGSGQVPARQGGAMRDTALLETGWGPGPHFADPLRTMFLTGPRWLARLAAAQAHTAAVAAQYRRQNWLQQLAVEPVAGVAP